MPRKIDLITELYKRTIKDITSDSVAWRAFLHSAAYQYKYPFADQVLIYAQRPHATACAETQLWNSYFGRWVNRGATGIALIDGRGDKNYLKYVFDVSDTHDRDNKPFDIWGIKPEYEGDIIEALQNRFIDDDKQREKISDAVISAAINLGSDNITDYLHELAYEKEGSFLEEYDEDNLRVRFLVTVQASVAYTVLTRLGFNAEPFVGAESFEWVHEFNTPATVNILGTATSDISEICLREIERTVKSVEKSIQRENRTFDGKSETEYNNGGKAETLNRNGGNINDIDLQDTERSTDPELGAARADEPHNREVRSDEIDFLETTQKGNVHDDSDRGQAEQLSSRDRRDGESADRDEYIPDGTEPWGIGEDESREPDAVGADDELDQAISRGRSVDVPNLRISDSTLPEISDPESLIQILRHGDHLRHSKEEIVSFLTSDKSDAEKAEYVKSAYPPLLFAEFYKQGTEDHLGYRADDESLLLYTGSFTSRTAENRMEWAFVTRLIEALITDKNYLDKPIVKEDQQMSLFDMDMPEVQTVAESTPQEKADTTSQMRISQEVIDELLRLGGCTRNSNMRIYEYYRRAKGSEETIPYLRREYQSDSVGITVDDKNYSAKWDDAGIRISTGDRVSEYSSVLIPWDIVDKRVRELMNLGQYLSQQEAEKAKEVWSELIKDKVHSLLIDSFGELPDEEKFWLNKSLMNYEARDLFIKNMDDPEKAARQVRELRAKIPLLEKYPPHFRYAENVEPYFSYLDMHLREPIDFPDADPYILPPKLFVTQDKFDDTLLSHRTDTKLKHYSFFLKEKDQTKRAKHLSDSFGTGGSLTDRFGDDHNAKGWVIYGGLCRSNVGMHLKWSQVAKRIDEFIRKGVYLSDKDKAEMDNYERKDIGWKIKSFYSDKMLDVRYPYDVKTTTDFWGAVNDIAKQIESKDRLLDIIDMMQEALDKQFPGTESYNRDKQILDTVKDYSEGKYNLFPGSPYRKKPPFAPEKKEVVQEPVAEVNEPIIEELPDTEYDLHLGVTVHIGKDEYEILSLAGDKVELFDGTLIPLEMELDTFLKRIRENPLNDGLLKEPRPAPKVEFKEEMPKPGTPPKQTRKGKKNEPSVDALVAKMEESYARWNQIKTEGSGDPFWEDGVNMNLVRNHIISYRRQILELVGEDNLPDIFDREIPPEVPQNYVANADAIREAAKKTLEIYQANETYQWCKEQAKRIPEKILKKTSIPNILGYVTGLESAIENDRLIDMRRHRNANQYLDSFDRCKSEIEKILPQIEHEQRTEEIFASLMNEDEEAEEILLESDVEKLSIPAKTDVWERFTITKTHYPDRMALIRVGDFYELLDEDAVEASDALELTLTGRSVPDKPTRVPMCGFPYHTLDKYLQKLQDKGFKVVIAEEDKEFAIKEKPKANQNYSDVEIAEILPADGKEILRLYEYRFSDDRFYVDEEKGEVTWLYFNPDSTAGGQFVENVVSIEQILALKENEDYTVFFDKLGSEAKQTLVDVGDEDFRDVAKRFLLDEYYYHGFGTEAREELISIAEELEQVEKPRLKGEFTHNFSLRLLPFEGGVQGIFDNVTGQFIGSNGQIFRYAEHSEALKDLNGFQRVNGFAEANIFTTENGKEYHEGDTLFASFEGKEGVHLEIERIDEHDVWYTMPSEPGQEAVSMDRYEFEKYLDKGNISVLFSSYPMLGDDRSPEDIAADRAEEAELTAVSRFLHATKMDDVEVYFDVDGIVATDGDNEWRGKDFYEFLLNDVIALDENLAPVEGISINEETLKNVIALAEKYGAHIVKVPSREPTELEIAKKLIEEYCMDEFYSESVDFSDLTNIGIGYTTITDDEIPIQVVANLVDFKIEKYLADDIVEVSKYDSLHDLIEHELRDLNFTALISVSDNLIEQYNEKYGTGIPQLVEEAKPRKTLPVYNTHPEIPDSEKHNYRITDNEIGMGGAKEKFRKNIAAINLLHELEFDNRLATPEEQEILAQYSGWGGLADAFDETKDNWHSEFTELYTTLSPEEYEAAKESTLTAFYTPPVVIKAMYNALENMGFKRGNVLEPSCGVGNFMGLIPESMDAKMYGVELDSLSGRIARQLYQKNGITIDGYEKTHFPDSFFDVAIGNVPFNDFKLLDKKYDKYNFLIHDYFFAKTLDKVRPGGVIAFITSSGTLDKENPSVRKYISQRADFLGAIRLPNNTFDGAGANKVVSDIIFLQKRDRIIERDEDWVHLGTDENGIKMNQYFIDHPDMVLGEVVMRSGPYGPEPTCKPYEDEDLGELLTEAISNIHAEISEVELDELTEGAEDKSIPADPTVKNFSFTIVDGKVYYRQNSVMNPVETSVTGENRIKGMIGIRDTVKALIEAQLEDYPESEIKELQSKLNRQYDEFTAKYGLINSRGNAMVFSDDNSYFLLCSLEILDENKELKAKADMFTKRTIKPQITVDRVDTASEALALSMGERAMVDMEYMSELTGKSEEELFSDLKGVIFRNPEHGEKIGARPYLMADEYLSGNVREKLKEAKWKAEADPAFADNVEALEKVQPEDLSAAEIGVRLGSTWIPQEDIQDFVHELLGTPFYMRRLIEVKFIPQTSQWVITNKTRDRGNVKAANAYGTHRINGYEIIEESLNLKDVRIFDYPIDENGNKKQILNKKETAIAQGKQEQIKRAFDEWIWKDPARRERLCKLYNERFNSLRPREFDGSHIKFFGMNPEITLRKHQSDAVARIMYGGNSLLAHVVGAGKTFTMVAAAQESKRLGLCNKSMFVVPNHLIEQWASEYLQLYPSANILVATKKDFETKNRKKFCARIATGDYDAVIIGHSQFEKIPMSLERQIETLNNERDQILQSIEEIQASRGDRVTVKQLAKARKQIETKLAKLNDQSRKDDVVTFEELGVDRLFVDEAHFYKNLAAYTKMRNVAGISQTEAQKSSDLYMKCRYLDELTGGKGCVFATGTPISNTMVELYTMQKYLQYDELQLRGLLNFDAWASTFGETVTAIELAPDGSGYRAKTRFAKFFNIPELMAMFKQTADIQTADMLNLPVPEAHYHIVKVEASEEQKELVESFAERAERVHNRMVSSTEDNMLLITNDGRKAALDQRLVDIGLGDYDGSKVNTCVQNVYEIWEKFADKKAAQLVFCDLSTPKDDGSFNVYDDIRNKLVERGIPPEEIAFIHAADTDTKKKELFAKVRRGQVRVLMGSTFKMGAGTNVQQRLIALHDLDVPWRPSDLEQRAGRIVRQGNSNPEVDLYRYVTEGTFDAYSYQLLESKQKFISQIMTSKSPVRSAEDVDETALSYAEIKALASGNPKIMEKMQLDADVAKLKLQKADHLSQRYSLEDALIKKFPRDIADQEERIKSLVEDMETAKKCTFPNENGFSPMEVMGTTYTEKAEAGKAILAVCERINSPDERPLGEYRGFKMEIGFDTFAREFFINLKGKLFHKVPLGQDANGIITRLDNAIEAFEKRKLGCELQLEELHKQVENAKAEIAKPFAREAELEEKCKRLSELNAELNMDRRENEIVDGAEEQSEDERDENSRTRSDRNDR